VKYKKICVVGLGYIGLPTAATFATHGLQVLGVDINLSVVESLQKGKLHILEPGLDTIVNAAFTSGKLKVASKPEPADAFIIAVPTPFHEDEYKEFDGRRYKLANMSAVVSAAEAIMPLLQKGNLVILESTSPPRTTIDLVSPILERSGLKAGTDFFVCYSPERVLPGQIMRELIENARVMGGITSNSAKEGSALYSIFVKGEIYETDSTTAEMVKLMENTTRDVNIAIANEFSRLAEKFEVNVWEAIQLANKHPRINILNPGPGVGGHCISVDPWFLVEQAPELTTLIFNARKTNDDQPAYVIKKIESCLGRLQGKKIAALGLAYKPDVDDVRESPAVEVVHLLQKSGAQVYAWEPFKPAATINNVQSTKTLEEALGNCDALLILVKHTQFSELDPLEISKTTSARIVIDTVQALNAEQWNNAGFQVFVLGNGKQ